MEKKRVRRVMIGTPSYDGKVAIQYADSLKETILLGIRNYVEVIPVYIAYDALVQKARNDLFALAYNGDIDDLIFIDTDIGWNPNDFFKLLNHPVDFVGGTYRKKNDNDEIYVLRIKDKSDKLKINDDGLIEVLGLGMGFCRLTKSAINKIWKKTPKYFEEDGEEKRMVFNVTLENNKTTSEDISFCNLWTGLKGKIYLDSTITCVHVGVKSFVGNFSNWLNKFNIANEK